MGGLLAVATAACSSASSTTSSSPQPSASASSVTAALASIPSGWHPNLKGVNITLANQGSPSVGRISTYNVVSILRSWGANANIEWASSPQIASSSILHGTAQVLISTIPNLLPGVENGLGVEAFGLNSPRLDYAFVSVSSITSISQLKGKTIGVYNGSPSDITWVLMTQALNSAHISNSQVHIVESGTQTERIDALAAGKIQATPVSHDALIKLKSSGVHNLYDFTVQDPNLYNAVLWATPSWLQANPKAAVAVDMAELETARQLSNPSDQTTLVKEDLANTPGGSATGATALLNLYRKYNMFPPNDILTSSALSSQEQLYYSDHTIDQLWPLSKWATTAYDTAALKALGQASS